MSLSYISTQKDRYLFNWESSSDLKLLNVFSYVYSMQEGRTRDMLGDTSSCWNLTVEWSSLIGPDLSRYSALIGGLVMLWSMDRKSRKVQIGVFVPWLHKKVGIIKMLFWYSGGLESVCLEWPHSTYKPVPVLTADLTDRVEARLARAAGDPAIAGRGEFPADLEVTDRRLPAPLTRGKTLAHTGSGQLEDKWLQLSLSVVPSIPPTSHHPPT